MPIRRRLAAVALLAALVLPVPSSAAGAQADTVRRPLFTKNDLALASIFVGGTILLHPFDKSYASRLQNPNNQANRFYSSLATMVREIADPGSFLIGGTMYAIGRATHNDKAADLGLHGTEALVVGAGVANVIKGIAGRARPYVAYQKSGTFVPNDWKLGRGFGGGDYASFPSGHTTAAFAAAAAVANETSRWWPRQRWLIGSLMYGGATAVGLSRMYNNKHWASDVMMGAAIGTFAGNKVVRYHHKTNPGNRFDRWLLGANLSPAPDGGLALSLSVTPGR